MINKPNLFYLLIFLFLFASQADAKARKGTIIGSLDINTQETGDGAGCIFSTSKAEKDTFVFVERDGFGWMRINDKLKKYKPSSMLVMWPSKKGDKLNRAYKSEQAHLKLDIEVTNGCGEQEDNCAVIYKGNLTLSERGNETVIEVKGHCAD